MGYVKIILKDGNKVLQHYFLRSQKWDFPGGVIEAGETALTASRRELLERTGYDIPEDRLFFKVTEKDNEQEFYIYEGDVKDSKQVATPGEKGGYLTNIRWI